MRLGPPDGCVGGCLISRAAITALVALLVSIDPLLVAALPPQSAAVIGPLRLGDPVPVDPRTAVGTLQNGLRYYVHPHTTRPQRVALRLVIRAGSIVEDDDQLGMASFLARLGWPGRSGSQRRRSTN